MDSANRNKKPAGEIAERILANVQARARRALAVAPAGNLTDKVAQLCGAALRHAAERVIVIGASTGGTEAIREVLIRLPANAPAVLVAQHIPENFVRSFVGRLDSQCKVSVMEARHDQPILPGHAYVAPGHSHLLLRRQAAGFMTVLSQGAPVHRHRPAVDVLFTSAAHVAGPHALGVILTGMGRDGAHGLLELRRAGAHTIAQNDASCVVFGMPREAIALGAACEVVPLWDIARHIIDHWGLT